MTSTERAIRSITVTPPAGEWVAVTLQEAESHDGPWEPIQALLVTAPGPLSIAFRASDERPFYRTIWTPEGGLTFAVGETQRLGGASKPGKRARIGGGS